MLLFHWLGTGNAIVPISPYVAGAQGIAVYGDHPWALVPSLVLLALFCAGLGTKLWRDGRQREAALRILALLFFLPAVLWSLSVVGYDNTYIERTTVVLAPYFACVLGWGAAAAGAWRGRALQAGLLAVTLASFAGYHLRPLTWTVYKQNPDWRSLTRYLDGQGEQQWLVLSGSPPLSELRFYAGDGVLPLSVRREEDLAVILTENPRGEFFFVVNRYWTENTRQILTRLRETEGLCVTPAPEATFDGLDLYRVSHAQPCAAVEPPG
jgi:hypothetical protein